MIKKLLCLCIAVFALAVCGCGSDKSNASPNTAQAYAVITDDTGKTVTLDKKPQRVVVLSSSLMNFAADVGGELAGRPTIKSDDAKVPDSYQSVPEVGPVFNVSAEAVIALKPDLIIASKSQHEALVPLFEQNGIKVVVLNSKTYDDVKRNMTIFGQIFDKKEIAEKHIEDMDKKIEDIRHKFPGNHKKIAIIHATPSQVSVEMKNSIAGSCADILGLDNVAADGQVTSSGAQVPYSMEKLAQDNPGIIFITTMGKKEKVEQKMKTEFQNSPAWSVLEAVKNGRVYVLPENLFLLNPGLSYPESVEYMGRAVYGELH